MNDQSLEVGHSEHTPPVETPRERVAALFAEIGLDAFEPEVIAEAHTRDLFGIGKKPAPAQLDAARRFGHLVGIQLMLKEKDLSEIEDRFTSAELAQLKSFRERKPEGRLSPAELAEWESLTTGQRDELLALEPILKRLITDAMARNPKIDPAAKSKVKCAVRVPTSVAVRARSRSRERGSSSNTRTPGSRRITSSSAGGGSSGSDPDLADSDADGPTLVGAGS